MERTSFNISIETNSYITQLENISRHITIYVCLFYLIIGNIGSIFKILFFLQKPLRKCPCCVFVLAATMSDFITLNNIPILKLLSSLYPSKNWIHMTNTRLIISSRQDVELLFPLGKTMKPCKIRNYLHMWSTDVSIYLLLFASVNRYFASSNKLKRQNNRQLNNLFCSFSNATKISFGSCIVWALISLHHYFNFTIVSNFCIPKHFILWAIWIFDIHCIIPTTFMMVFSTLTLINVRKSSSALRRQDRNVYGRASSVPKRYENSSRQVEQQLTLLIITETTVTMLTTVPYAIYIVYQVIRTENGNLERLAREDLIEQTLGLTLYIEASSGFFIYLFTLKTLRKRFVKILLNKLHFF